MRYLRLPFTALIVIAVVAFVVPSSRADAGGWAVASFDKIPELEAGVPVEVGFTVLQHGVHPATPEILRLEEHDDGASKAPVRDFDPRGDAVGVAVDVDGSTMFFPAEPSGAPGHYVATVEVGEPGMITMYAEMSGFGSSDTFEVDVASAGSTSGNGVGWAGWIDSQSWFVFGLLGVAAVGLVVVVGDLGRSGGRRGGDIATA